jgi:hypothetical protein
MVEAARQALEPVTFTPAEEPPARRPSPPERQSRESAVTFTPTPSVEPPAPLEPAFAPKRPGRDVEVEVLPDALRSTRPAATPAAAPRPSRVQRRTFGSGLQAEPEPVASVVRWPYVLALVAAVGAAVYWYAFRPRTVFVPVAQQTATEPVDSTPPQGAAAPVESLAVEPPPAPAPVDSAPVRPPVPAADALTPLDLLVDSLDAVIFQYLDRAAAFDAGQRDCQLLSAALVGVDRLWVAYNAQRRRLDAPLDSLRTLRDQAAYANVEAVDTHFGRSGCPRP